MEFASSRPLSARTAWKKARACASCDHRCYNISPSGGFFEAAMVLDETTFTLVGEMGLDWFEGVTSLQDLNVLGDFEARPHSKVELWLSACCAGEAGMVLNEIRNAERAWSLSTAIRSFLWPRQPGPETVWSTLTKHCKFEPFFFFAHWVRAASVEEAMDDWESVPETTGRIVAAGT